MPPSESEPARARGSHPCIWLWVFTADSLQLCPRGERSPAGISGPPSLSSPSAGLPHGSPGCPPAGGCTHLVHDSAGGSPRGRLWARGPRSERVGEGPSEGRTGDPEGAGREGGGGADPSAPPATSALRTPRHLLKGRAPRPSGRQGGGGRAAAAAAGAPTPRYQLWKSPHPPRSWGFLVLTRKGIYINTWAKRDGGSP